MLDDSPLSPRFVAWPCDHCGNGIEFDAVQLADRDFCRVSCPHCGQETSLQEPPPPLVPDEGWTQPAQPNYSAEQEPEKASAEIPPPPPALNEPAAELPAAELPPTLVPKTITVALPPEPLPPTHTRAAADVRWLTDLGVVYFKQHQFGEAFLCFRKAAQQGFATAQFCLAVCYFNGHGTDRDEAAALPWLRQAAAQGDANAEFTLGLAYSLGRGVAPDAVFATQWLEQAAAHGHPEAILRVRAPATRPAPGPAIAPAPAEKTVEKRRHELQRLILGLFGKKS